MLILGRRPVRGTAMSIQAEVDFMRPTGTLKAGGLMPEFGAGIIATPRADRHCSAKPTGAQVAMNSAHSVMLATTSTVETSPSGRSYRCSIPTFTSTDLARTDR